MDTGVCPTAEALIWTNIITMAPPTIAGIAAVITALRLGPHVRRTEQRAEQLYNGEFARGRAQGHREDVEVTGDFTLR